MKEIIGLLKQKRNIKYTLWVIIFGLIFAFIFHASTVQISQILEKSIRIVPGTEEARQYQVSGWQGARAKGKKSVLKVSFPERKTYQMVIRAFSCSPPLVPDQRVGVYFNNIALDRLKFRKITKWQEFSTNLCPHLLKKTNTIKFVYSEDTSLFPIVFDYLEFRNYTVRLKGLYLLFDQPILRRPEKPSLFLQLFFEPVSHPPLKRVPFQSKFKAFGFSLIFIILLWAIWLLSAKFLHRRSNLKLSQTVKLDLLTYFPSLFLFSLFTLISFFSKYQIVYSVRTFFILLIVPTLTLKTWFIYRDIIIKSRPFGIITQSFVYKTAILLEKGIISHVKLIPQGLRALRISLIQYHKKDLSFALILDFMLLLILSAFLLMTEEKIFHWGGEQVAIFAYWLLAIGVVIKLIQLVKERKTGDRKRFIRFFIRTKNRWKVPLKKIILGVVSILLILLVSLFLWLILPGKGVEVTQLIPQETFTFLILKIDLEDPGTSELINNFSWRIRRGARFLGPVEIAAFAVPAANKEEPDYLLLAKNNRLIKTARLFRKSIDRAIINGEPFERIDYRDCRILHLKSPGKEDKVSSYTLFKDVVLASNNLSLLKSSLDQYGKEISFISGEALSDFQGFQRAGKAMLLIDNSRSELSRIMKRLEEENAYAIFPTVDSLNYLGGYCDLLDADSLKGSLFFKYQKKADIKQGEEDVYFLAGLLKRFCWANGLNFEEEIITDNHYLKLNFKLSGLKAVINNFLAKEKKW